MFIRCTLFETSVALQVDTV